jgi:hypothetical protein
MLSVRHVKAEEGRPMKGSGWRRLTADDIVQEGKAVLYGLVIRTSVTGGDVSIYDGLDASSGRFIDTFEGIANESRPISFGPRGIHIDRGIFVDIGSNVDSVLVLYDPVVEE